MKFLFFLAIAFTLEASVNQPLRCEFFSGYRNDRIHWHLQNPTTTVTDYSEIYRDVQFWENGLVLKTIHRDIAFLIRGSYSAFGRGTLHERYADLGFTTDQPQFQSSTTGWAADGSGYISYAVNLTEGRTYKWIFLPLLGYSGHFEHLKRSNVTPKPFVGASYQIFSTFPEELRQSWYGFFLGASFQIEPGGRLLFNVGYTYHWLRTRFMTQWQDQIINGSSNTTTNNSIHANRSGNLGQTGWAQVDYCLSRLWRLGFGAQIHYFSTTFWAIDVKQNGTPLPQTFKLRWTPVDGWFQVSREF